MGSEFTYEDLSSLELSKFTFRWLRDETYKEMDCFVVERIPKDADSGYRRIVSWIDKKEYRYMKVDYYDRKKTRLKTMVSKKYEKYLDKFWRAGEMHMKNHQSGKRTVLVWQNYQFKTGLSDSDFNQNSLKRAQ